MARMTLEEKLAAVSALERDPSAEQAAEQWQAWLNDADNMVVARAASIIGRKGWKDYNPALVAAFLRLLDHPQPIKADKLSRAKEAIVLALDALENPDPAPYLAGIRYVQPEPGFGEFIDTAAVLRGHCAAALINISYPEVHFALAPLLFDPETPPRLATIKALSCQPGEKSELLLRMKALAGDAESAVLGECFTALLALEPERSLPFVADYLHAADRTAVEQAALAIGNSRLDDAFPLLRARWEANTDFELRRPLLLAMVLTRTEDAFVLLLSIMRDEGLTTALLAVDALAIYGVDRRYRERIEEVVAASRNPRLSDAYLTHFPPAP